MSAFDMAATIRSLTPVQRRHVLNGCISGDFTMATVHALLRKRVFRHEITSPNGRAGPLVLTLLGEAVRAQLQTRASA